MCIRDRSRIDTLLFHVRQGCLKIFYNICAKRVKHLCFIVNKKCENNELVLSDVVLVRHDTPLLRTEWTMRRVEKLVVDADERLGVIS